jgi:predicted DNA-binding transcriptional regulator AlpA
MAELLTMEQVSELFGCTRKTLMRQVNAGVFPAPLARSPYRRKKLWPRKVVEEVLSGQLVAGGRRR